MLKPYTFFVVVTLCYCCCCCRFSRLGLYSIKMPRVSCSKRIKHINFVYVFMLTYCTWDLNTRCIYNESISTIRNFFSLSHSFCFYPSHTHTHWSETGECKSEKEYARTYAHTRDTRHRVNAFHLIWSFWVCLFRKLLKFQLSIHWIEQIEITNRKAK